MVRPRGGGRRTSLKLNSWRRWESLCGTETPAFLLGAARRATASSLPTTTQSIHRAPACPPIRRFNGVGVRLGPTPSTWLREQPTGTDHRRGIGPIPPASRRERIESVRGGNFDVGHQCVPCTGDDFPSNLAAIRRTRWPTFASGGPDRKSPDSGTLSGWSSSSSPWSDV